MRTLILATLMVGTMMTDSLFAQTRIDGLRPDAPELAVPGAFAVGIRALSLTDPDRVDVINSVESLTRAPRTLVAEMWYPAASGTAPGGSYETVLRDGITPILLAGQAARDAQPSTEGPFPLVIISHGYPGNRFLMAHLAENIASKGYVVVALDHTDSTYSDQALFGSTLYNRPLDQAFALDAMAADTTLAGLVDTSRTGLIGYSMGGYGALIFAGAGVSEGSLALPFAPPQNLLAEHRAGSPTHEALMDPRLAAVVAIGPWGMNAGFWDAEGLAGLRVPMMMIAGSMDMTSIYPAMRQVFDGATGAERHLLTFVNAGHNAAAPIPAPAESWAMSERLGWAPFGHYADPVWDTLRMNNIAQHFVTAFLDLRLKGLDERAPYLTLVEDANDGIWSVEDGQRTATHTYWEGFEQGSAVGLRFETRAQGE